MLLEIEGLSKSFGGIKVLTDVSLSIESGTITSVIGPNGSGKTTLFNTISGFVSQDRGSISYKSRNIDRMSPAERVLDGIGRLWQDIRLFRNMSVMENLLVATKRHPGDSVVGNFLFRRNCESVERRMVETAIHTLELLGLGQNGRKPASDLSYGEQKLVAFGRLLMNDADFLLVDEPTSGLNSSKIDIVFGLMQGLVRKGKTVLMIEHNVEKALEIADRVYVMDEGRIEIAGSPSEVRSSPLLQEVYLGV